MIDDDERFPGCVLDPRCVLSFGHEDVCIGRRSVLPPIESIQHLFDVFIEGGWAEEEDLPHLDQIHSWLEGTKDR